MDLYREKIGYDSSNWKTRTAHHKPTNKDEDRKVNKEELMGL